MMQLPEIPDEWSYKSLAQLTEDDAPIRYGVVQIGPDTPGGVPIVPIKFIDKINEATLHRASAEIEGRYANSRIKGGDVLISVKGTIGNVGVVPSDFSGNIAREIARIRPKPNVDRVYLAYQLQAPNTQRRIGAATVGTTRLEFSIATVREFKVAVPPRVEQERIAEILDTWDRAIEATEKLIANSQAQKKALMQQILTGEKRLPDFTEKWRRSELGQICSLAKGEQKGRDQLDDAGPVPVINGGVTPSGYTSEPNTGAYTITISEGGNSCGYVDLITQPFWCGGHCYALTNLKVDRDFLYAFLKHKERRIMSLRVGSGLPNIQKGDLKKLEVLVPTQAEQVRIGQLAKLADNEIGMMQIKLSALEQEKAALMQQLLNGKRRVKIEEAAA